MHRSIAIARSQPGLAVVLPVLLAVVLMAETDLLSLSELLRPLTDLTTMVTAASLQAIGYDALVAGNEIFERGDFGYRIGYACTGIWSILFLCALIAADRNVTRSRRAALLWGISVLWLLNLGRLVTLYITGVSAPEAFGILHGVVWPLATAAVVAWLWLRARARKTRRGQARRSSK